jgi:hypothetical protein
VKKFLITITLANPLLLPPLVHAQERDLANLYCAVVGQYVFAEPIDCG